MYPIHTLLKRIKGTPFYFPYIAVLTAQSLIPHFKATQNDSECLLLLHHLKITLKSLTTRNLIQEMSCPRPKQFYVKILLFRKRIIFQNKPNISWTLHANLNLRLSAFVDMNFGLIFLVRSIQDQISANLWIFRKMP